MELELQDSRRLTGANILSDDAGAVIDVSISGVEPGTLVRIWREHVREALDAVDWSVEKIYHRIFSGGASLAISAPIDSLYAATEITEWAWKATKATLDGMHIDLADSIERLRKEIETERNPAVLAMQTAASGRGVLFLWDDDNVSVGMGTGSLTWTVDQIPPPDEVPWEKVHDIPCAMVTGSNGKTTTVRMLAAIAQACGYTAGHTCTDGIFVDGNLVEGGDYSGPGGARRLVRDRRVSLAILETARGGMLRRGLGIPTADAALVSNVCEDHLGEWGANSIEDLVEAKIVIRRAVTDGAFVVNADDDKLVEKVGKLDRPITWISLNPDSEFITAHLKTGGSAALLVGEMCVFVNHGHPEEILDMTRIPATVDGHARHNVYNALGAIALARSLGLPADGIRRALMSFGTDSATNRGRTNFFDLGGARLLVDFAHNPHGARALMEMADAIPSERTMVMIGQAGDRDDASIRELTAVYASRFPDLIIVKEMKEYLRGREVGEVTGVILDELERSGFPRENVVHTQTELEAVQHALAWCNPGDFLILPVLQEREEVLQYVQQLLDANWRPGEAVPTPKTF